MAGETGLADARRAGQQNAAAAVNPLAAQHVVQSGNADGNALGRCLVLQLQRRDREHGDAPLVDQERKFVGAVRRAAVFYDPQAAGRDLPFNPVIQQQHAVGDIFFHAVPGERAIAPLGGDHGGDSLVLEPAEEAAQLGSQDADVLQAAEQRL